MSRRVVVTTLVNCDVCGGDCPEDTKKVIVTLDRKEGENDLCDIHKQELKDFLEPYLKRKPKKERETSDMPPSPSQVDDDGQHVCKIDGCTHKAKTLGWLNNHKNKEHPGWKKEAA